jgi:hypothetical protein
MLVRQTSLIAYNKNVDQKNVNSMLVLSCVPIIGSFTAWEITNKVNNNYNKKFHRNNVQPRLNELVKIR